MGRLKFFFTIWIILFCLFQPAWADQIVKKSKSSICHAPDSPFYERTKNYTAYDTIGNCLSSGGRLPKGQSSSPPSSNLAQQNKESNTRYSRSKFGNGWADEDRDCQNTRQEILISLSTAPVRFADENECRVTFGRWISMYSGKVLFDASEVDIDHVVPLKWAWDHGAKSWTKEMREKFANDPINLVPVEASLNRAKGAKGPDEWLPPKNQGQYEARFQRIVLKYKLGN